METSTVQILIGSSSFLRSMIESCTFLLIYIIGKNHNTIEYVNFPLHLDKD